MMVRRYLWWMVAALLLSAALSIPFLDYDIVWYDEFMTLWWSGGSAFGPLTSAEIWQRLAANNPVHTVGYFMTINVWGQLVGWQPAALRALSLLFGLLMIALVYRLCADMISRRVGLYAALVLAASGVIVHFNHELRMYTLFPLTGVFTLWVYLRIVNARREPKPVWWLALFVGTLAALYTHYYLTFLIASISLYHLLFVPKNRRWWAVTGVMASAGLLVLPWVNVMLAGLRKKQGDQPRQPGLDFLPLSEILIHYFSNNAPFLFAAILPFGIYAAFTERGRRGHAIRQLAFITLTLLVSYFVFNALFWQVPERRLRYLIGLWPLFAIGIGLGLAVLRRWRFVAPALLGLWMLFGIWSSLDTSFTALLGDMTYYFPVNKMYYALRDHVQPSDTVLNFLWDGGGASLIKYYGRYTDYYFDDVPGHYLFTLHRDDPAEDAAEVNYVMSEVADSQRVWVTFAPDLKVTRDRFTAAMDETFYQCPVLLDDPGIRIDQYARAPVCCLPPEAASAPLLRFGDGIALVAAEPLPADAGDTLPVSLLWSLAPDVPPDTYSVTVQMLNASGEKVAQADYGLETMAYTCQQAALPLDNLPPGEYRLMVGVYPWQTGVRLTGTDPRTGGTGDLLEVGRFRRGVKRG